MIATGFLATECPSCDGSGAVPENHGQGLVEWLGCPDCHATGWVVHSDVPAISIQHLNSIMSKMHRDTTGWEDDHFFNQAEGWNDALRSISYNIDADFDEAR